MDNQEGKQSTRQPFMNRQTARMRFHADQKANEDGDIDDQLQFSLSTRFDMILSHSFSLRRRKDRVGKVRRNDEDLVTVVKRHNANLYNFHTIFTSLLYGVLIH